MTHDQPYCSVEDCGRECQPTGPAFCPEHWKLIAKPTRKYLLSEYAMGERCHWADWFRAIFNDTVATIARRLAGK